MIFRLSLRNIISYKRQSAVVILFITTLTFFLSLGLFTLYHINTGLSNYFKDNITGDYMIVTSTQEPMSIFGAISPGIDEFIDIPILENYDKIYEKLLSIKQVNKITSKISGSALFSYKKEKTPVLYFGIEPTTYIDFFDQVHLDKGRMIEEGKNEVLINNLSNLKVKLGDEIQLLVSGNSGFKIQALNVVGFYSYTNSNSAYNNLVLINAEAARKLKSINDSTEIVELDDTQTDLLDFDLDMIFNDENNISDVSDDSSLFENLMNNLEQEKINTVSSDLSWNFILLKASDTLSKVQIEQHLHDFNEISVLDWGEAAGQAAYIGKLLILFFVGGIILALFAGAMGIINVTTISILKRMKEFGTIRAIGGQKTTVVSMIIIELLILSTLGGVLGSLLGVFTLTWLNTIGIKIGNQLLIQLVGSQTLNIEINYMLMILTLTFALLVGILSSIYPLKRALKITPLEAIIEV